jgi:RimJ/RimL family protein N-acetyltransferase
MEYLPSLLSREESDAFVARIQAHFELRGFGFWAVEVPGLTSLAGLIGLAVPRFEAHFTPCVEIGWRLAAEHWGRGYAIEGARAVTKFGFEVLELREIVAFTSSENSRSRRVMEKLGMVHSARDDFDHPSLPEGHPLRRHVLYRLTHESR